MRRKLLLLALNILILAGLLFLESSFKLLHLEYLIYITVFIIFINTRTIGNSINKRD